MPIASLMDGGFAVSGQEAVLLKRKFKLVPGGRCGDQGGGAVITTTMMIMAPPAIMMVALQA